MRSIFAVALLATALGAGAAYAQEFKNEATPLFDSCGDPSYENAKANGITVGISPSPPFTSINPDTQKAEGLEDVRLIVSNEDQRAGFRHMRRILDRTAIGKLPNAHCPLQKG